jgi:hypothetical protein
MAPYKFVISYRLLGEITAYTCSLTQEEQE